MTQNIQTTVAGVRSVMDKAYPPYLAEKWDAVGLICGDPQQKVHKIVLALDCTQEVAEAAVQAEADMLIVHHPLLLRGVTSVAADTPKGKVLHTLIRGGVALFAAHTNADSARPGVNDKLAELVGIVPGRPVQPKPQGMDKWGVQVPAEAVEAVKSSIFHAGAGNIGKYSECSFDITGTGQFLPQHDATPYSGVPGDLHKGPETRVEFVAPRAVRSAIMTALRDSHPYEEPAFDVISMEDTQDLSQAQGLGRIGTLPEPISFADFVQQVADALPETSWGVRAAGDPEALVQTIAVSSGAGDSFLDDVARLGVDVYVTSDLRHHPADESRRAGGPFLVDTAHWASEYPWTTQASEILKRELPGVEVDILPIRTDPWTLSAHPQPVLP
ncbi:Nif3-like dinuclear metal center hexameric protein [Corynebacterium pseudotuberculosis]|uniref:GTP cyclohydrolase 1 type 2 homolog n=2 Tax=Corynebacterium pseudotuberculosis TaxID=1719 RepID=D9QBN0_CORP2|nr:Nif3-like dinuclear metal center hexameric protein [Corynebacterium pseudotuberculosis]ADK29291.1 Nif3-like dinuclear metal center hexameric protein [Corynebacterium pseudotuberculosis FRC41]ADL10956.1 Nif3-like dinuclear metal center hexameric protein [Corynebacterium pseudotuberculosis C231]ADL21359.1 Nif3-like dinuclear metal center hexameric protein [Corynebacterium pseudotuberculosis 1002]ADO26757.1 Nif3-like dinuclear metal center hexameric protein [Corynebacterium pseudotuberculosis I